MVTKSGTEVANSGSSRNLFQFNEHMVFLQIIFRGERKKKKRKKD